MDISDRHHPPKNVLVAFDFDGTLTKADTMLAFIRFTHGRRRLFTGFLRHVHWLAMMKLGLYSNGKVKERIFSHFYQGTTYGQFVQWGCEFAQEAETLLNERMVEILRRHLSEGHTVCVVTASIDEWVRPICKRLGVSNLLATQIEVSPNGTLTGRFSSPNCYGKEKVARLLEAYPQRNNYQLFAYGDSRGDRELLALAELRRDFPDHEED